jgi:hypothetical protein
VDVFVAVAGEVERCAKVCWRFAPLWWVGQVVPRYGSLVFWL